MSLEIEAYILAANLVGALEAAGHAAIVIRQAHLQRGNPEASGPFAEAVLAVPFRVPVRENHDGSAACGFDRRLPTGGGGPEAGGNPGLFGRGGCDGAGEGGELLGVETVACGGGVGRRVGTVWVR